MATFMMSCSLPPGGRGRPSDYKHVLGVAHNAGNNLGTLATALR
jgi:hypothetical protein